MKAIDIMTAKVVAISPDMPARKIAQTLIEHAISAVPVIDEAGRPLGIVSEGDLIGRSEPDREARRDWWLALAAAPPAAELLAALGDNTRLARDIMVSPVITVDEKDDVAEIARLLASYRIKRVPVLHQGKVIGIVSRADLLRALAAEPPPPSPPPAGLLERAFAGLDSHFGNKTPAPAVPIAADDLSLPAADDFKLLVQEHRREEGDHRREAEQAALEARRRRVEQLIDHHILDDEWRLLLARARTAAKAGEKELLLLRFPSQLCSDGGRAINITEPDWPATLRGEAAELYLRWERDLKPQGFHLAAQILDFPGGFPGDVGLFLIWGE